MTRDLGVVNKLYRGLSAAEHRPGAPEETTEKLLVAVAETFAIGGACQLLLVVDHTIAEHGCRLNLPARKEGIIPGAANLRLPRFVGDRAARQAIFSGREFEAGSPEAEALCDEVVAARRVDEAIAARVEALTSSGMVNAAANRRGVRVAQEPLEVFRALHGDLRARAGASATSARRCRQPRAPLERPRAPAVILDAIETAPRGELEALQLERLQATVRRILDHVEPLAARLRAAGRRVRGRTSPRSTTCAGCRSPTRPTCASTTRSACWPCRASRSCACTPRAARAASPPSSATRRPTSTCGPR